jgi:hypothetical protein
VRPYDQVVLEAGDQARTADLPVRREPVRDRLQIELTADPGWIECSTRAPSTSTGSRT